MAERGIVEKIYAEYKTKIDTILAETNNNYTQTAEIISWFYGGSVERWRHVLKEKKGSDMPKSVKTFLNLKKPKNIVK